MDDQIPEIRDKRTPVQGILQQHRAWIGGGLAVIAMIVLTFQWATEKPTVRKMPAATTPDQNPPGPDQVAAWAAELKKRTDDLAVQKTAADQAKQQAEAMAGAVSQPGNPYGQPQAQYGAPAPPAAPEKKHESNIAFSYRNGATGNGAIGNAKPQTPQQQATAGLQDLITEERTALARNIAQSQYAPPLAAPAPLALPGPPPLAGTPAKPLLPEFDESVGKKYRLFEGTLIETTLVNRLNGSFTGPVDVMVTTPVYSHDQQHVLIPQGARVEGTAEKVGVQGQQRLAVVFHRIIMPDGFSTDLDKFAGLNQIGEAGLNDKVDHHYLSVFGTSVALGLIQGFSLFGTGSEITTNGIGQYRQGVASSIGQSSTRVLDQRLNILPTITIREGHRVRVVLSQDIELPTYSNHRVPGDL